MGKLLHTLTAVGLLVPFVGARADLVLVSPNIVTIGGTGLGNVNTVLTISSHANGTFESGCVGLTAPSTTDVTGATATGGICSGSTQDVQKGQTQTRTLSEAGITSADNFTVFFNASQPGGAGITLNTLVVNFYNALTGQLLHSASYAGPHDFASTANGTGQSGYEFNLNSDEASTLQGFIGNLGAGGIRVGMSASAGNGQLVAAGGNETFFIFNSNTTPVSVTPEPSSVALVATGLFGVVGAIRRRRRG
jgi:hypothetical protein